LTRPDITAAVNAGKVEISKRLRINQDEVIKELAHVGFSRMSDFAKWGPGYVTLKDSGELTEEQVSAVSEVKEVCRTTQGKNGDEFTTSTISFKLHDKVSALKGILDRVKPGADDPQKVEVTHKMTYFPPEPSTMEEYEDLVKKMKKDGK
jgi:hypothetical protein